MGIINISREMPAPLDTVWSIISNLDQEPLYWHGMKSIRNLARIDANVIEEKSQYHAGILDAEKM